MKVRLPGGVLPVAVLGLVLGAGCTVPNPRLCKNDPACIAQADLAGAAADSAATVDAAPQQDAAVGRCSDDGACAGSGGGRFCDRMTGTCQPCNRDDHCGTGCSRCTGGGAPFCSQDGTRCVVCRKDGDCSAGSYCRDEKCQLCTENDHCGASCAVCTGSAHPVCKPDLLSCGCVGDSDCGNDAGDKCSNGVCTRSCLIGPNCATAPAGSACLGLAPNQSCGCSDVGKDCPPRTTSCTNHLCLCGKTVCKSGQTCMDGVCK